MITDKDILEIKINPTLLAIARERASAFKMNKYTQSNNIDSRVAGFLAEETFYANFAGEKVADTNYKCDIIHSKLGCIDLKTKRCKSRPLIDYECSVSSYQLKKIDSDYLMFCRCDYEFNYLWFLGLIKSDEFVSKSKLMRAGDRDGAFICRTDMYQLPISQLYNFSELLYS
jgi:hypothetical protein